MFEPWCDITGAYVDWYGWWIGSGAGSRRYGVRRGREVGAPHSSRMHGRVVAVCFSASERCEAPANGRLLVSRRLSAVYAVGGMMCCVCRRCGCGAAVGFRGDGP
jgi:hypothetical protein